MDSPGRWSVTSLFPKKGASTISPMNRDETERMIRAITAREPSAANAFQALPEGARKAVLETLDAGGLKALTDLIVAAKKKRFETANERFLEIAAGPVKTPVYLIDESLIEENVRVARLVKDRTGCKVLHALKAYASFATFPTMARCLDGVCASGLHEARLGRDEFGKEVHAFAAAYKEDEFTGILDYSDVVIFNSFYQLEKYGERTRRSGRQTGLRVNPGHAEVTPEMYNPCASYSRLGITHREFDDEFGKWKQLVDGLHFHALCEQNSDVLERVLNSLEKLYGRYLGEFKWVNFGGGHHIARDDYDVERLVRIIRDFQKKYDVQVYLEPGESNVLNAGVLISTVLDIVTNGMEIAILDASAEDHMPDVLLMPYRPNIFLSGAPHEKSYTYRIAGPSCLAGDIMGDYSFDRRLKRGDKLVFSDMALYSIVKNTTFNGINLPDIAVIREGGRIETVKSFGYRDYKDRQS